MTLFEIILPFLVNYQIWSFGQDPKKCDLFIKMLKQYLKFDNKTDKIPQIQGMCYNSNVNTGNVLLL